MKFDTRDVKPKLWGLLIQALLTAFVVMILILSGAEKHILLISVIADAFLLAAIIQLIVAFFRQLQYNPYSYNAIYYMGFALFLLVVLILQLRLTVLLIRDPGGYTPESILHQVLDSAKVYMLLTAPFLLAFSAGLFVSNIALIRHEGRRLTNVLGIILSFLLVAGEVFLFCFDYYVSGSQREVMIHDLIANLFAAVYL